MPDSHIPPVVLPWAVCRKRRKVFADRIIQAERTILNEREQQARGYALCCGKDWPQSSWADLPRLFPVHVLF